MNLQPFRTSYSAKFLSAFLALAFLNSIISPVLLMAGGGEKQADFKQINSFGNNMVDPSTGDFSYSIPIMTVPGPGGGFPITLNYSAGITMEQEATWTGLGWSINPGSINRSVSQFPDDLKNRWLETNFTGSDDYSALWDILPDYNRDGKEYNVAGGTGSLSKINDNDYKLNFTKTDYIYGSLYQSEMPSQLARQYLPFYRHSNSANATNWNDGYEYSNCNYVYSSASTSYKNTSGTTYPGDESVLSDVYQHHDPDQPYYENMAPAFMAYDNYMVSAGDISGAITPVRFDNPSVAVPRELENLYKSGRVPTLKYKLTTPQSQKVQFRYKGEPSGNYDYHLSATNDYNFNYSIYKYKTHRVYCSKVKTTQKDLKNMKYDQTQPVNLTGMATSGNGFNSTEAELAQSKYVRWYTVEEMGDGTAENEGLMLSATNSSYSQYCDECIGAFKITNANGVTYHFSLAAFVFDKTTHTDKITMSTTSARSIELAYPTQWLLTGITGADFEDVNDNHLIDAGDKGYYVSLEYGNFALNEYFWRYPYAGSAVIEDYDHFNVYETGYRDQLYLNRIVTPTHTALFVKDYRDDGKSHGNGGAETILNSLQLSEIILIRNEDIPGAFDMNAQDTMDLYLLHAYDQVILSDDITAHPSINDKAIKKVVFTYDYSLCNNTPNSYTMDNSGASPPSYGSPKGKLTLKEIQEEFPDGASGFVSPIPPYSFEYQSGAGNPSYNASHIDGNGYYRNTSIGGISDRKPTDDQGVAWNLEKITTPEGAEMTIEYERDRYSNINGNFDDLGRRLYVKKPLSAGYNPGTGYYTINSSIDLTSLLSVSQPISFSGSIWETCDKTTTLVTGGTVITQLRRPVGYNPSTVTDRTSTTVKVSPLLEPSDPSYFSTYSIENCEISLIDGYFLIGTGEGIGGDIRVEKLHITDPVSSEKYTTAYEYQLKDGKSSGACTSEPEMSRGREYSFYDRYTTSSPKVFYERVLERKRTQNETMSQGFTEYSFYVPHNDLVTEIKLIPDLGREIINYDGEIKHKCYAHLCALSPHKERYGEGVREMAYRVVDRTAQIGLPKATRTYNRYGDLMNETLYEYYGVENIDMPEDGRGILTQACNIVDKTFLEAEDMPTSGCDANDCHKGVNMRMDTRLINTIWEIQVPSLYRITTTSNGITNYTQFNEFDFLTGIPKEIEYLKDGQRYIKEVEPAYDVYVNNNPAGSKAYAGMGSKFEDPANTNMLSPIARTKLYHLNGTNKELLSASVQTYSNSISGASTWMPHQSYVWNGAINRDGTLITNPSSPFVFTDFHWNPASAIPERWELQGENKLYDSYHALLESFDGKRAYQAIRKDNFNNLVVSTASNARYTEFTHWGGELIANPPKYEGDVVLSTGASRVEASTIVSPAITAHTGDYILDLPAGEDIQFDVNYGLFNFITGKKIFHMCVWEHTSTFDDEGNRPVLRAKVYGGTTSTDPETGLPKVTGTVSQIGSDITEAMDAINCDDPQQFGDWYLYQVDIEIPAPSAGSGISKIEFILDNGSGIDRYFDDFRIQPHGSEVNYKVYNEKYQVIYELNDQNTGAKFEYDDAGSVKKAYNEIEGPSGGFKKVMEYDYNYSRNY